MKTKKQEVRFQKVYVAGSHSVREEADGYEIAQVMLSGHRIYKDWREAGPQDWANLIAAAPDMLKTLRAILERCGGRLYDTDQETGETFDFLVAASIAKAEGAK